ncbi:MAG: hypothetical protein KIT84_15040 [Labilithrix sp.]|nr:hypothetical protein [Labilithrix sp.]MCW5812339.1 hypothetical protein [Labilithrix sp.]
MSARINLADPAFEPTGEQLQELSRRAFAHVAAERKAQLTATRERIRAGRAALRKRLAEERARGGQGA